MSDPVVDRLLEEIKQTDAGQFEEIVHGMAILAREVSLIEPRDRAWDRAQRLLTWAAETIAERRSN